jgi:hypothetical protein
MGSMPSKPLYLSRTFWFNLVTGALLWSDLIPLPPRWSAVIVAALNIALRIVTNRPVGIFPE